MGRPGFWLGNGILLFLQIFLELLVLPLVAGGETSLSKLQSTAGGTQALILAGVIAELVVLLPLLAVGVKRLADLGRAPLQILIYHVPGLVGELCDLAGFGGTIADRSSLGLGFDVLGLLVFALYVYDLGVQPGATARES